MDFLKKFTESSAPKAESTDKSEAAADQGQGSLFSSAQLVADAARSTFQKEPAKHENAEVAGAAADLLNAAQTYGKLDKTAGVGSYVEKAENYLRDYETSHTTKPAEPATEGKDTKPTSEEPVAKPPSEEIPSEKKVEEPTEPVKPTSDEPSSKDVTSEVNKEEKEPIKEETKPSIKDVPSESQKAEETKPSYGGKEEEEVPSESAKPSAKEPETEPTSGIPSGVGEYSKIAEGFLKKGDSAEGDAGQSDQIGQYVKAAEGFFNKQSEGSADDKSSKTEDSDQSGLGGVAKLAGSFLK